MRNLTTDATVRPCSGTGLCYDWPYHGTAAMRDLLLIALVIAGLTGVLVALGGVDSHDEPCGRGGSNARSSRTGHF